jgi:DNA-3-methyladenine glycosylase II
MTPDDLAIAARRLAKLDPTLGRIYADHGPPPLWQRPANFSTFVRIVLEQQVSLASAKSSYDRLVAACGGRVSATAIAQLSPEMLAAAGLSRQKSRYITGLAEAVLARRFSVAGLVDRDDEDVRKRITSLLGFGNWSADIYLIMALMRPDVLPTGDLGLVKGLAEAANEPGLDLPTMIDRAERWRPYRSVATRMIWQLYLIRRGKDVAQIATG